MNRLQLCACLALLSLGCDPDAVAGAAADLEAYYASYDLSDCARDLRCDAEPEHASVDACLAARAADDATQTTRRNRVESVGEGTLLFYPSVGDEVVALLDGSCEVSFLDILFKNAEAFEGQAAVGDACRGHYECATAGDSGGFCFSECTGFFGEESLGLNGMCVADSPIGTSACP